MAGWMELTLLALQAASPAPDPRAILQKAGERYFGMTAYSVAIRVAAGDIGQTAPEIKVRIDAGEDRELRLDLSTGRAWISDGETLWIWDARKKEYREMPAEGPEMRWVRAEIEKYVGRYAKLAAPPRRVEFVQWERVKSAGQDVWCAVIRLYSDPRAPVWRETLSIDPETGLVLRSSLIEQAGGQETFRETTYEWLSAGSPAPDADFHFTPLAGARRRR